jgi:hypothetical protein
MTKGSDSRAKNSSQNMPTFTQFCRRMWLDHCDENKTPLSITYTEEEYKKKFNQWLLQKYAEKMENK